MLDLACLHDPQATPLAKPLCSSPSSTSSTNLTDHRNCRFTESTDMKYEKRGPDFALCGKFAGTESAARWLKKFDYEMQGYAIGHPAEIPASRYLQTLDILLEDDATLWAEATPEAASLLANPAPSQEHVRRFKQLLIDRYPARIAEAATVSFDAELRHLTQGEQEPLLTYYRRVLSLMTSVGARDRPGQTYGDPGAGVPLSRLEEAMLASVLRAFVRGLKDNETRDTARRAALASGQSLHGLYLSIEEARRLQAEYEKYRAEEEAAYALDFYRQIVERNMPKQQLKALRSSYQPGKPVDFSVWTPPAPVAAPAAYPPVYELAGNPPTH